MANNRSLRARNLVIICVTAASIIFLIFYSCSPGEYVHDEADEYTRCFAGIPCLYEDVVDFRIIVITFDRPESLAKLLRSIEDVELDGDRASLEIWVDRDRKGRVHKRTLDFLRTYSSKRFPTRVHVQSAHAGIYGQWIDTWRPTGNTGELALILEDDISVSKYMYRWIKAVHKSYGSRDDFAGATLTSDELKTHDGLFNALAAPKTEALFMYKCIGTWGFSPGAAVWRGFQDWYHTNSSDPNFVPAVPGIAPTQWYAELSKEGRADSMWEQWFIYYAYQKKLFTVYNNLRTFNGNSASSCLCINRREVGLHSGSKGREDYCTLLNRWDDRYVAMPTGGAGIVKLDWNGKTIDRY